MAITHRPTQRNQAPGSEPRPLTLWVAAVDGTGSSTPTSQDAATTEAIGLQLDAHSSNRPSRPHHTELPLSLKRRTVEFLFDPVSGETRWLHSFGLGDELDTVTRCYPNDHATLATAKGDDLPAGDERSLIAPSGRIARCQSKPRSESPLNPKAESEHDSLVGMLVASGWTWRDADDTLDH